MTGLALSATLLVAALGAAPAQAADAALASNPSATARRLRIMPLGDSITRGLGSSTQSAYRTELYRMLGAAGLRVNFVGSSSDGSGGDPNHEGHSGWRIQEIAAEVDGWLDDYRPDVVLLHIGTNDMRSDLYSAGAADRLGALIDRITTDLPEAEVFVAQITGARNAADQRRIDLFNSAVPGIVAARHDRVHLVDQRGVDSFAIRDNFHPNDAGYAMMAWTWYRAMEPVLNTSASGWPTAGNPYAAQRLWACRAVASRPDDCRWWYRRSVVDPATGQLVAVRQTQRYRTERYAARAGGTVVARTRSVLTWSNV